MQINKSDRNDAIGIARIMQTGWFKEVHVKDIDSHSIRALLASSGAAGQDQARSREPYSRPSEEPWSRHWPCQVQSLCRRAEELIEGRPELVAAIRPLLEARNAVGQQVSELDRKVMKLARHDAQVRRFMTAPGIGPITALAFKATIDDPARFARSRSVGAYVGLTSRRHASGEVDWTGRISKCGDAMLRSYLFEAAGGLLTRVSKWSDVKAWGLGSPSATGSARPRLQSHVSSRSFCIACGSTEPSSTGRRRRLPPSEGLQGSCQDGRKRRPSRDDGDGEFVRFFASVRKARLQH